MRKYVWYWLLWLLAGTSFACEPTETIFLDTELDPYFERFALEARNFGLDFDYQAARVEGYLTTFAERQVRGKCEHNSVYPDRVYINLDYWRQAGDLEREYLVFHELGHCFLDRSHLDDADQQGRCISMMQSGAGDCQNNYRLATRSAYLAELFSN